MRLSHFSVSNYRSITKAYKLPIGDLTVLIGPNNEGKSNILAALDLALATVLYGRPVSRVGTGHSWRVSVSWRHARRSRLVSRGYDLERDLPAKLRNLPQQVASIFVVDFELTPEEQADFREGVGSQLTTALKLRVVMGGEQHPRVEVVIQSQAAKRKFNEALPAILDFLQTRFRFEYVPSIRDAPLALDVIDGLLATELAKLRDDSEYGEVLGRLEELQRPVLDKLGSDLQQTLHQFIPEVQAVRLDAAVGSYGGPRRSCQVYIDDGTETELELKGDGIKSLAAIALIRHATVSSAAALGRAGLLLAVEEPEAHLHPRSVRTLKGVLGEIAATGQVVISTHSPLLADADHPAHNILVSRNKAVPAKAIAEVRSLLGVELADNLQSAQLVLLVEGDGDKAILTTWLAALSPVLRLALTQGRMVIEPLGGASKLRAQAQAFKAQACAVHACVDDDKEGRRAVQEVETKGILGTAEVHLAVCPGMDDSELEDLVKLSTYREAVEQEFGISLDVPSFRNSKAKWSDRVSAALRKQGKTWSEARERRAKEIVAERVQADGLPALHGSKRSSVDALCQYLAKRLAG